MEKLSGSHKLQRMKRKTKKPNFFFCSKLQREFNILEGFTVALPFNFKKKDSVVQGDTQTRLLTTDNNIKQY